MRRLVWFPLLALAGLLRAAAPSADPLEMQVTELVAGPQVTVVHFWAPWCPNCRAELDPATGWAKFIAANPDVKVVSSTSGTRDRIRPRAWRPPGSARNPTCCC